MSQVKGFLFGTLIVVAALVALAFVSNSARACQPVACGFGVQTFAVPQQVFVQSVPSFHVQPFFVNTVAVRNVPVFSSQQVFVNRGFGTSVFVNRGFGGFRSTSVQVNNFGGFRDFTSVRRGLFGGTVVRVR